MSSGSDPFGLQAALPDDKSIAAMLASLSLGWTEDAIVPSRALVRASASGKSKPGNSCEAVAPPPPAPRQSDSDVCNCGQQMRVRGSEYLCPDCGMVVDTGSDIMTDNSEPAVVIRPRIRVVGPGQSYYQRDLERASVGDYAEQQLKSIREEYKRYNWLYKNEGGNPLHEVALEEAARIYNTVQRMGYVKRSQCKRSIMAAALYRGCIERDFIRSPAEVAAFMRLPSGGIAKGDDFLRQVDADHGLGIDMNKDTCGAHVRTTFCYLKLQDDKYQPLRKAVQAVVQTAVSKRIATSSQMKSKVIAVTYVVLTRAGHPTTLDEVREKCRIRKNTITKCLAELDAYHSYFVSVYRKHGLDGSPRS